MSKNKYEQYYQAGRDVCGRPFPEFLNFFEDYKQKQANVLDLGCGQGRDALFIARKGHVVVGVDLSPTGIKQMVEDAQKEGLAVTGIVANIVDFVPEGQYDVILFDRILHMLDSDEQRTAVLVTSCNNLRPNGHILIADMAKHRPLFQNFFENHPANWMLLSLTMLN